MNDQPFEISLQWGMPVDLDLCVFYRTPDGKSGGVFSDEFRSNPADLGDLNRFPFMQHLGDVKEQSPGRVACEYVKVGRPEHFDRLDVVAINYDEAIDMLDVDYSDPDGICRIGEHSITARPEGNGQAYHVATLSRDASGKLQLQPVNRVLTLREAYDSIPGFALICE